MGENGSRYLHTRLPSNTLEAGRALVELESHVELRSQKNPTRTTPHRVYIGFPLKHGEMTTKASLDRCVVLFYEQAVELMMATLTCTL